MLYGLRIATSSSFLTSSPRNDGVGKHNDKAAFYWREKWINKKDCPLSKLGKYHDDMATSSIRMTISLIAIAHVLYYGVPSDVQVVYNERIYLVSLPEKRKVYRYLMVCLWFFCIPLHASKI